MFLLDVAYIKIDLKNYQWINKQFGF
ncbi:uncharacterized protein METZ01_LOCUS440136 [marine metagenome]|uniref:Uncharacterized protein n=1 Tax=marine metagenome TaxID=408172 RepID=A0A382YVK2_9ZZZZ